MKKVYDVVALGELLVDFTANGSSEQGNPLFEANPGGAPCNVLSMLQKLKKKTAFIGKVGKDSFGKMLRGTIEEMGIDSRYLLEDREIPTTLAFVQNADDGERSFTFYRNPGADMMLSEEEIPEEVFGQTKIFHFGTLSMTHEGVRKATLKALELAKKNKVLISLDPNLREPLWSSLEEAREQMLLAVSYCDVLKISDNEIQFLSGKEDYEEGIAWLRSKYDISLICLTLGKEGSRAYYKDLRVEVPGFPQENSIDATGAGDTFCGCVLGYLCDRNDNIAEKEKAETEKAETEKAEMEKVEMGKAEMEKVEMGKAETGKAETEKVEMGKAETGKAETEKRKKLACLEGITEEQLREMLTFANGAAALLTTKKGAIRSMPDPVEVEKVIRK